MRQAYTKSARAGCTSGQRVLKANHGLLLLTSTLPCSQSGFTKHDDSDLLATRARCVDVYKFPNDQSDDSGDDIITKGNVTSWPIETGKCARLTTNVKRGAALGSVSRVAESRTFKLLGGNKMSSVEHQATVDKGLKMKIKRKGVGAKNADSKHEIVKNEGSRSNVNSELNSIECATSPVQGSSSHDAGTDMCSVGVSTDPECLGPCEPGTSVTLEGIVWHETQNGILVINVTWRGKTYVGTLLDATRHDWAPPRLTCDSPVSDLETVRTPKGRGKRGRGTGTPVNDRTVGVAAESRKLRKGRRTSNANGFQAPPSPAKTDVGIGAKRKGRPELEPIVAPKRSRSSSRGAAPIVESPSSALIQCPEPNCNKKYKHINGLRYHQTHAHQNAGTVLEEEMEIDSKTSESEPVKDCDNQDEASKDSRTAASVKTNKEQDSDSKKTEKPSSKSETFRDSTQDAGHSATKQSKPEETPQVSDSKKSESGLKKKDPSLSTSSTATSNSVSKSSISPQVYQLASAPIGCLGSIPSSQAATSTASTAQVTTSLSSGTSLAPTNGNTSSGGSVAPFSEVGKPDVGKDFEKATSRGEKSDKSKTKASARPIMPAPPPQMIALSTPVPVSHSNLAPVSTHAQMSPSLKPIQPKPTIMGEPSSVNPSLMGLKDKKSKSKKKSSREKDKDSGKSITKDNTSNKEEAIKCERTGVIKSLASPSKHSSESFKKDGSLTETSMLIAEAQRSVAASGLMSSQLSPNLPESGHGARLQQSGNRDLGKAGSPLRVNTPDRKSPLNEDVQSPAYSDISDANDSGSPSSTVEEVQQKPKREESESKKDDNKPKPQQHPQTGTDSSNMSQYGMYAYYGHQAPYMMQNVQQPHNLSQNSQKAAVGSREEAEAKSQREAESKKKEPEHVPPEATEDVKPKLPLPQQEGGPPGPGPVPSRQQMTPQQMQEYQAQQQKWLQQMYALQTLPPQYQYLAAYGYAVDPAYHMHLMNSDPHYRQQYEKIMEEQKRTQDDRYKGDDRGEPGKDGPKRGTGDDGRPAKFGHQPPPPKGSEKPADLRRGSSTGVHDKDAREQNLREKQCENHQIMKENIELKSQMDREKSKHEYEAAYRMQERQEDELRRYYMYQQQKMLLQQRMGGDRKVDLSGKMSEPSPGKGTPAEKPGPDIKPHSTGVEHSADPHRKDCVDLKSRDNSAGKMPSSDGGKLGEDKSRVGDKVRNEDPRTPRSGYPNVNRGSPSSTCAMTPTSSAPAQGPYASYISYPYMQSPYGHQMPFDPSHPMYRGINPMIGYAQQQQQHANSTYLHPSQLGYRSGPGEIDEKAKVNLANMTGHPTVGSPSQKVMPPTPETDPKAVELLQQHHASPYYQGHKIHELQEKGRSSSRSSPPTKAVEAPAAQTAANFDKQRDLSTNSPPTQRHVHTHHHTHVLGGFPVYGPGPYGGKSPIIGQQSSSATTSPVAGSPSSTATTPGVPHPFPSK